MKKIFLIAEIGINHNGDISICKELINIAKESGCDAVKFQKRDINKLLEMCEGDDDVQNVYHNSGNS